MSEKKPSTANTILKQARLARKWSQRRLAQEVGVETQTVRSWERGTRSPSPESLRRLCKIFAATPEQLGFPPGPAAKSLTQEASATRQAETSTTPQQIGQPTPASSRTDINRRRMLRRVRALWIDGVLDHSLYHATLITLGLQKRPDAVINPWRLGVQESDLPPRPLPDGARITNVYDEVGGELLILGDPGAGKTTLLLEL